MLHKMAGVALVWCLLSLLPGGNGAAALAAGEQTVTGRASGAAAATAGGEVAASAAASATQAVDGSNAQTVTKFIVHRAASLKKARKAKISGVTRIKKEYYYLRKGKPLRSKKGKVVEEAGKLLFVESSGKLTKGWHQLGKKLYYTKAKGIIQIGGKADGLTINAKGYVKATPANVRKVMMDSLDTRSAQVLASIAGSVSGRGAKLQRIWNFMSSRANFGYIRTYETFQPSTARSRALTMLNRRAGNCYDFACGFAALAKAAGYDAYVVYGLCPAAGGGMTTHGWTYLVGAGYFDVEGNWAGWGPGVYGYGSNPYVEQGRVRM